jgi:hypothetical protein
MLKEASKATALKMKNTHIMEDTLICKLVLAANSSD